NVQLDSLKKDFTQEVRFHADPQHIWMWVVKHRVRFLENPRSPACRALFRRAAVGVAHGRHQNIGTMFQCFKIGSSRLANSVEGYAVGHSGVSYMRPRVAS